MPPHRRPMLIMQGKLLRATQLGTASSRLSVRAGTTPPSMLRTCIGGCAVAQLTVASLAIAVSAVPQNHEHGAEQECARRTPARTPAPSH